MRFLVVGAGAIGGYFGGRMLQAGCDVTFLVRPRRAAELATAGLVIKSPHGDVTLTDPPTVQRDAIACTFDVVLLSCKAYDLDDAIKSCVAAVGPKTSIVPLLNGIMHLDALDGVFGRDRVMGGLCTITVTLNKQREVVQLLPMQSLIFGDRSGKSSERVRAIAEAFDTGKFNAQASENVMQDMWEKWVFLASLAASTCLMRASLGDVLASPGGRDFLVGVVGECSSIASARGFAPRAQFMERALSVLISEGSELVASMFRDIEARSLIEGDQVIGDPIARGDADGIPTPRLHVAYTHLKVYERRRSNLLMGV